MKLPSYTSLEAEGCRVQCAIPSGFPNEFPTRLLQFLACAAPGVGMKWVCTFLQGMEFYCGLIVLGS